MVRFVVVAAGHQHRWCVGSTDPVLELKGEILGDGEFRQDNDRGASPHGIGDQPVDLLELLRAVSRADREGTPTRTPVQGELGEAAVGMASRDQCLGGDQLGQDVYQAVVEHHAELDSPLSGQTQVPGCIQPVRQPPRW